MISKAIITIEEHRDGSLSVTPTFDPPLEDCKKMSNFPATHTMGLSMHELVKRLIEDASRKIGGLK